MPAPFAIITLLAASLTGSANAAAGPLPTDDSAQMTLLMGDDFIEAHLILPAELVPSGLHGKPVQSGPRSQPPYVNLLEQSTSFFEFPVESRCHSDGGTLVRLATGLNEDGSLRTNGETPPAVPEPGTWISTIFQFHCDAQMTDQLAWIDFNLFDDMPALREVTVEVLDRDQPVRGEYTPGRRRFVPNP
jgi:hypothetical protein